MKCRQTTNGNPVSDRRGFLFQKPLVAMSSLNGRNSEKRDLIWWPTRTALDRQLVEIGVPFQRKTREGTSINGEWIIVLRDEKTGFLKSRVSNPHERAKF
ncbi:MAG: hypothetical protein PHU63_01925 [Candidatus ainarchaeum sp.]|nr:hypothetical protein [Candidatus ainarchaeum sp.]